MLLLACASRANAHPVPFTYLDVRVQGTALDVTLVAHVIDVAHDLKIEPPERLFDPAVLQTHHAAIAELLGGRLTLSVDNRIVTPESWSVPEPLAERQSIRLATRFPVSGTPGLIAVNANLFPYDPQHQTFVNVYEGETIASQAILDRSHTQYDHFTGSRTGTWAVIRRFVPAGVHHILIGPDHLLFLIGLLLLGGTLRQLCFVVTAFTVAHSITLSLAALNLLTPPARMIEPAIALSIVYVGADNLMVRGGRDVRAWIAFAFGLHPRVRFRERPREMDLPRGRWAGRCSRSISASRSGS